MKLSKQAPTKAPEPQNGPEPQSDGSEDYVVKLLKKAGLPVTRENYIGLAYPEGLPEDFGEEQIPV
jgi:hypothetical protein